MEFKKYWKKDLITTKIIYYIIKRNKNFKEKIEKLFKIKIDDNKQDVELFPRLAIFLNKYNLDPQQIINKLKVHPTTVNKWKNGKVISPRKRLEFYNLLCNTFGRDHEFSKWYRENFLLPISPYDMIVSFFRFIGKILSSNKEIKYQNNIDFEDLKEGNKKQIIIVPKVVPIEWEQTLKNIIGNEYINIYADIKTSPSDKKIIKIRDNISSIGFIKPTIVKLNEEKYLKEFLQKLRKLKSEYLFMRPILKSSYKKTESGYNDIKISVGNINFDVPLSFYNLFYTYKVEKDSILYNVKINKKLIQKLFLKEILLLKELKGDEDKVFEELIKLSCKIIANTIYYTKQKWFEAINQLTPLQVLSIEDPLINYLYHLNFTFNCLYVFILEFIEQYLELKERINNKTVEEILSKIDDFNIILSAHQILLYYQNNIFSILLDGETVCPASFINQLINQQLNESLKIDIDFINEAKEFVSILTFYNNNIELGKFFTLPFVLSRIYSYFIVHKFRDKFREKLIKTSEIFPDETSRLVYELIDKLLYKYAEEIVNSIYPKKIVKKFNKINKKEDFKKYLEKILIKFLKENYLKYINNETYKQEILNIVLFIFNDLCKIIEEISLNEQVR